MLVFKYDDFHSLILELIGKLLDRRILDKSAYASKRFREVLKFAAC